MDETHGVLQLQERNVEALSNVLGYAQGHVGLGEAGKKAPHFQDSNGAFSLDLACPIEVFPGQQVHFHIFLGFEGERGGREGRKRRR